MKKIYYNQFNLPTLKERLEQGIKINEDTGCWEWQGRLTDRGYVHIRVDGKKKYAHRVSYKLYNGDFDETLDVCHKCDNPKCINPDHLFLGTHNDNMQDMFDKGRRKRAEHPSPTTYKNGCRCEDCKELHNSYSREWKREYRKKQKELLLSESD